MYSLKNCTAQTALVDAAVNSGFCSMKRLPSGWMGMLDRHHRIRDYEYYNSRPVGALLLPLGWDASQHRIPSTSSITTLSGRHMLAGLPPPPEGEAFF